VGGAAAQRFATLALPRTEGDLVQVTHGAFILGELRARCNQFAGQTSGA
jgi:hypothetical protein